jgi:ATPase family associated with various cellular activities (AAA)
MSIANSAGFTIAAVIFGCIIAAAVVSLWRAPFRDPDAPLADRKKKRRGLPHSHAVSEAAMGRGGRTRTSQTRRGQGIYTAEPQRGRRRRDKRSGLLPSDATVTFADEREEANIDEVFTALDDDLVGLVPIKKKVQEIAALLLVDRARKKFGLEAPRPNMHMCFTGPPGTGKTTVALRMADLLHRLGYLNEGQLVHAMRDDLVGQYVGQTAPRTKKVLERAMGGVLFIDEAPTTSTAPGTRWTTARKSSISCSRSWRTSGRTSWSSWPATRTGWTSSSASTPA